jgi:NifU-like N terminal domain
MPAGKIKNTDIVQELNLPPVNIHCSALAEDAIKAAWMTTRRNPWNPKSPRTTSGVELKRTRAISLRLRQLRAQRGRKQK